jgi:TonB family protein
MGSAMDNSPLPTFLGSALPGRDELPIPLRLGQPGPLRVSDPLGLIDVLRQALDGGTRPIDSILRAATDAARVLTGAHGTALALRTDGVILCRARSGDIAPALGAPLNVESGISGECLRSATILVCNDAASDPRVDREACLSLGVRSIVVVPLRGGRGMAGLMEAFSTRAYAFGTEQIDTLRALAEIAEAAYDRESPTRSSTAPAVAQAAIKPALVAPARVVSQAIRSQDIASGDIASRIVFPPAVAPAPAAQFSDEYSPKRRYWIPAVVVISLLLVSMVAWWSWRDSATEIAASETPVSSSKAPEATSGQAAARVLPLKPNPGVPSHHTEQSTTKEVLQNAAEIDPEVVGPGSANSGTSSTTGISEAIPEKTTVSSASAASEAAPTVEVTPSTTPADLPGLSPSPTTLPAFGARVSTGVSEATLIRKVNPIYPAEARIQRLAGLVALDATVAEDGSIDNIKIISGPPLLASAATAAVKQWRYSPSTLDGKPIEVQKRITIVFKLP